MMRVMSRVATARDFQSSERSLDMKSKTWIAGAIVAVFCAAAFGETKSDYDRSYSFCRPQDLGLQDANQDAY